MTALPPGSTIGILGGGQLGRMLALSAAQLGLKCHIFCPEANAPAFDVAAAHTCAAYDDAEALREFAKSSDAVTFEFENIPAEALSLIAETTRLAPGAPSLQKTQDRLVEKTMLTDLGIPVAPFAAVDDLAALKSAVETIGCPAILKTRRFGYDGKGQTRIDENADLDAAFREIGEAPAILEGFVPFECEVSVVLTRGADGKMSAYDLAENDHQNHILKETRVPARVTSQTAAAAKQFAQQIADELGHVGTLAVECFYMGEAAETPLLVNEIAPRVHNSGHWTQNACTVCQFENHIRAVAGWPLGTTERHSNAVMTNLIGHEVDEWETLAGDNCALHLYGKAEARPGRKMGHKTTIRPMK